MTVYDGMPRTAVLLGAGASFDAGLPLTHEFADKLIDLLEADHHRNHPLVRGMYFVYGAMVGYHSRRGRSPREAVNVETLISALRLLKYRDEHEVAPFVVSWNDMHDRFTLSSFNNHAYELERVINQIVSDEHPRGDHLEQLIRSISNDVISSQDDTSLYGELELAISTRVRRILLAHGPVGYLSPLLDAAASQPGGMDVATLNYDLTVEHAGADAGIRVDPGPEDPRPGIPLTFAEDASVRLYKLHGSIDLREEHTRDGSTRYMRTVRDSSAEDFVPRIVIGDRDKLGSGGATLALMVGFAQALENASRLVVVGYSFGDSHINSLIYDWLDADTTRTLTVLDPHWPHPSDGWNTRQGFARKLTELDSPRIAVVREYTAVGLAAAMSLTPTAPPDPRFAVTASWSDDSAMVTIQNRGAALHSLRVTTNLMAEPSQMILAHPEAAEESPGTWTLSKLDTEESVDLHLTYTPGTSPRGVTVSGDDDLTHADERWDLSDLPQRHQTPR